MVILKIIKKRFSKLINAYMKKRKRM